MVLSGGIAKGVGPYSANAATLARPIRRLHASVTGFLFALALLALSDASPLRAQTADPGTPLPDPPYRGDVELPRHFDPEPSSSSDPAEPGPTVPRRFGRPPPVPVWPLKVVSWSLDEASAAGAIEIQPTPQRVWRHTFGAERRQPSRANFDVENLDADIVLLQGVRLIAHARLLFPPRDWRVIHSRQIYRPVLAPRGAGPGWGDAERTGTTAMAFRFRRGVRIVGQYLIPDTAQPSSEPGGPPETPAALAIRLLVDRTFLWVVSADLPRACAGSGEPDDAAVRACMALKGWVSSRQNELVLVGGPNAVSAVAASKTQVGDAKCPRQAIAAVPSTRGSPLQKFPASGDVIPPVDTFAAHYGTATGCLARLELSKPLQTP